MTPEELNHIRRVYRTQGAISQASTIQLLAEIDTQGQRIAELDLRRVQLETANSEIADAAEERERLLESRARRLEEALLRWDAVRLYENDMWRCGCCLRVSERRSTLQHVNCTWNEIQNASALADSVPGRCGICGGALVPIRGRFASDEPREVCPTCLAERLDQIRDISDRDYGKAHSEPRVQFKPD